MEKKDRLEYIHVLRDMLATGGGSLNMIYDDGCSGRVYEVFGKSPLTSDERRKTLLLLAWLVRERENHWCDNLDAFYRWFEDEEQPMALLSNDFERDQWESMNNEGIGDYIRRCMPGLGEWWPEAYETLNELDETFYPRDRMPPVRKLGEEALDKLEIQGVPRLDLYQQCEGDNEEDEERYPFAAERYAVKYNESILFETIRHKLHGECYFRISGMDSDYNYKLLRLSPGCAFAVRRAPGVKELPEPMSDERLVLRFILAVTRIQWLTEHDSLPIGNIPFVWTDKGNVEAISQALDALLEVHKLMLDADLWWQDKEGTDSDAAEWLAQCKWQGTAAPTVERLAHVWGTPSRRMLNYVKGASCFSFSGCPDLVMLQGLLAGVAEIDNTYKHEICRRLRCLRHLVAQTDPAVFPTRLKAMLAEARELIRTGQICEDSETFCERQKREEVRKQVALGYYADGIRRLAYHSEKALRLFENHPLLRGAVAIFAPEHTDEDHFRAFCELFNDIDADYGARLRQAFESCGMAMERGTADREYWSRFLTTDLGGEAEEKKRQTLEELLEEPVRQFQTVSEAQMRGAAAPVCDERAYYNVYADSRERYLDDFLRGGTGCL